MTQLLISVRNAAEARIALAGGADVIDVKEPNRGSLGCAKLSDIEEVCQAVAGRACVSVALGELLEATSISQLPTSIRWAKLGLAGCGRRPDWETLWHKHTLQLPPSIKPVAVVYADYLTAASPAPEDVLLAAQRVGCEVLLIDTFDKLFGRLLDIWPVSELKVFGQKVHQAGMQLALAGSLRIEDVSRLRPLDPQYLAFRGAACEGARTGELKQELVDKLANQVQSCANMKGT